MKAIEAETTEQETEGEGYLREREEWFLADRLLRDGSAPATLRIKAIQHAQNMIRLEKQRGLLPASSPLSILFPGPSSWTLIGPQPINSTASLNAFNGGPTIAGRIAAIAVDPTNRDIAYLGAADGGVWKSSDAGANWTPITDNQPSLVTGSIAIDPTAASCSPGPCQIVYVGTGEANNSADSYYGAGILKSTDAGAHWTQLGASNFVGPLSSNRLDGAAHIGALAVDPTNNQVILAGAEFFSNNALSGVYRSSNGGANWTLVAAASGAPGTSLVFDPGTAGVVYAALGASGGAGVNGVYRSADHGATWTKLVGSGANLFPTSGVGRIDVDLSRTTPTTLYAAVADSSNTSFLGMFKTTDSGANWTNLTNTPDACTSSNGSQCFYDLTVRVDPNDANTVFYGGSTGDNDNSRVLFRSSDGGASWTSVANGAGGTKLHTDLHALAFAVPPTADRLYVGSDGGAYRSDNPTAALASLDYTDLNSTLAITMYYPGHTADQSNENVGFGGSQDNGSHRYSGNLAWDLVTSGDGGYTAQDPQFPSTVYTTCQHICIHQSFTGGTVGSFGPRVINGINPSDRVSFIAPLVHDPNTSGRLYFGTFQLYLTTDSAATWNSISPDLTSGSPSIINAIAVAPSDSNTVYVGTNARGAAAPSKIQKTTNALAGAGATWTDITSAATLPTGRTATAIGVDTSNSLIAYVSYSGFSGCAACVDSKGHVFRTSDGGISWQDISGSAGTALPNAPVNTLLVDPDLPNVIFVGTDVGVFRTGDASQGPATVWTTVGTGLPNVIVNSLTMRKASRVLRAATSGRSTWVIQDTNAPVSTGPFLSSMNPAIATAGSATITGIVVDGANFTANSVVQWNGSTTGITSHPGSANQMTFDIDSSLVASGGSNNARVFDSTQTPSLSKQLRFMVVNPTPVPAFINTENGTVGLPVALTITGSGFIPGTDIIFNGFDNTNGVVSGGGTQIDITIPGNELTAPGSTTVDMSNPPPGGGPAGGFFPFTISAAAAGAITTSPPYINFGNQAPFRTSSITNVTVTNDGTANASLNAAPTLTGANQGDFALIAPTSGTPCVFGGGSATVLVPSQNCTFGMTFTPKATGSRTATLSIPNTGTPNPQTLTLNGSGVIKTAVPGDFDGDGKTDDAVWRPSNGTWYVIPSSAPTTFTATQWGVNGDVPVRGDYDGDGKTDKAVWRPSSGTWYIIPTSAPTTFTATQWGVSGDIPVPGDYDGDGKTDMAVWRPSTGTWYILPSSKPGTFIAVQWGVSGDVPVPGDYDGDGKTDMAVWRPSTGTWYVIPTSAPTTFTATQWGVSGDTPVPGDYDGDGKTDMAVWRPSTGTWYIIPTSAPTTFTATQWGVSGDIPVPGDYDGDGKSDKSVWRPSTGAWYVIPSSAPTTFTSTQWGISTDVPVQKPIGH